MRKNTMRTFAVSLAMAMMLAGCQTVTPPETTPVAQSTEEKTEEATTTATEPVTEEPTSEVSTADETEEPTVEASTEDETTTEDATTEDETTEDGTSEEETNTEESTPEEASPEETTPEETTPAPTTPEPTTPEPTTPEQTTPAPKEPETTPAPVTAVSITGKVNGTHYIGDTLSAGDFVITVTMSDGSILTNPAGFAVSPLTLSAATNTLTCAYGGVSGTFTVNATERPVQPTQPEQPVNGSYDNRNVTYNGQALADEAMKYIGLTYVLGGNSLTTGTDCSGFTKILFAKYGLNLPRTAAEQWNMPGDFIDISQARPGDLVVADPAEYVGTQYTGHAGIYLGDGYVVNEYPGNPGNCCVTLMWNWKVKRIGNNTAAPVSVDHYVVPYVKEVIASETGIVGGIYAGNTSNSLIVWVSNPFEQNVIFYDGTQLVNGFTETDVQRMFYKYWNADEAWERMYGTSNEEAMANESRQSDKAIYLKYQSIFHLKDWCWFGGL